jgi:endonuclease-3
LTNIVRENAILITLEDMYCEKGTSLIYSSSVEFLIAVMLSAQCTDERVNKTTNKLFKLANTPEKILALGSEILEDNIRCCGLFHSKAKNIIETCQILIDRFQGVIPASLEELMSLPGVGRKTANVVLIELFHIPAIPVDTHVFRVTIRLGLAKGNTPLKVENELKKIIPHNKWGNAHHWLIWHGKNVCKARKPLCNECSLYDFCQNVRFSVE